MIRGKTKYIILSTLLALLIGGFVLISFLPSQIRVKSIDEAYRLIPPSVEVVAEVQAAPLTFPIYDLFLERDSLSYKSFTHTLYYLLRNSSTAISPFLVLSNSRNSLEDGFLILSESEMNKKWLDSYLNEYGQIDLPAKKLDYKDCEIAVYSLKFGSFFSVLKLEDYVIISNQISNLYAVIDAFRDSSDSVTLFASKGKAVGQHVLAEIYIKNTSIDSSKSIWNAYDLMYENNKISLLQEFGAEDLPLYLKSINDNQELRSFDSLLEDSPESTFSIQHFTQNQLIQGLKSLDTIRPLSVNEKDWSIDCEVLVEEVLPQGLIAYRAYDPVISSNLLLKSVDVNFYATFKEIVEKDRTLVRRLLREETISVRSGMLAIPSPVWLNELFEVSRDQRVLYLYPQNDLVTWMSWDSNLLNSHVNELKSGVTSKEQRFQHDLITPNNYFYIADLAEVQKDTLIDHRGITPFIKERLDRLTSFHYIDEYLSSDLGFFHIQSLKRKD